MADDGNRPGARRAPPSGSASGAKASRTRSRSCRVLPAHARAFTAVNKYVSVPTLKAGLGSWIAEPFTGYLMILRTRGRKSGDMRDAPLGYAVVGDAVYCLAGFGRRTNWYQNLLADPQVEVILPSRSFSGVAEEVTDTGRAPCDPAAILLRTMGPWSRPRSGWATPSAIRPRRSPASARGCPWCESGRPGSRPGRTTREACSGCVPIVGSGVLAGCGCSGGSSRGRYEGSSVPCREVDEAAGWATRGADTPSEWLDREPRA